MSPVKPRFTECVKGAPPALRTVSDREVPWILLDDEQEENGNEEKDDTEETFGPSLTTSYDLLF